MLVSDQVYHRIPQFWLIAGVLFLLLGLAAGPDYQYFYAYPLLSLVCILRSMQIYQLRRKINRHRISVLTETQRIERDTP